MQQVLFTVSYVYIGELIIDEEDESVWQSSSKGQATAPPSGEELLELVITQHSSPRNPGDPRAKTYLLSISKWSSRAPCHSPTK